MPPITSEFAYLLLILGLPVVPPALRRLREPAPMAQARAAGFANATGLGAGDRTSSARTKDTPS